MDSHDIVKALEVWTLQNLLNMSVMLGILACGLSVVRTYYHEVERHLTLRVSIEMWRLFTVVVVDVLLAIVVVIGYMVMNPDIMADIKMAVPFMPCATVLFATALVLRLFHDGHDPASKNCSRALYFLTAANVVNMVGFTFVMEAPSGEYLALHPSPFWDYVKNHLRSNASPHGLEMSQITFYVCFVAMMAILVWGVWSALRRTRETKGA